MQTTANLWEVLCRDLESQRQSAKAEEYHDIARNFLASARQVLRSDSPRMCDAIEIAGDICQAAGRYDDAIKSFDEALEKSIQVGSRVGAARLAAKLAMLHDHRGESELAVKGYQRALSLYEDTNDRTQHNMLLNQLGSLQKRSGDLAGAIKTYERAMQMAETIYGDRDPEVASAANNLAVANTEAGDFVKAENLHMQALSIRETAYGPMHPDVAQSMANLAVVYHMSGADQKAHGYYAGALDIFKRFRPDDDEEVQTVKANHAALLQKLGY